MKYAFLLVFFSLLLTLLVNYIGSKFNILIYKPNLNHKEKFKHKVLNTGGVIFFFYLVLVNIFKFEISEIYYYLFLFSIFMVGIFSDIKNLNANIRLLILFILSILYIYISENFIFDLKFNIINNLFLDYEIIAILFTGICIVILINGINFIDGVHGMVLIFSILVFSFLNYFLHFILPENILSDSGLILLPILSILLIFNLKEKIFFGDAGSYLIGAIIGLYIIKICNTDGYSYPYFYANLLIYPAYEVFFSIFRKILSKKGPYDPDKKHLHHLIQVYYIKKYNLNITKSKIFSAISINFFILIFNLVSINFYQEKFILIINIFNFAIFYSVSYYFLFKKSKKYF